MENFVLLKNDPSKFKTKIKSLDINKKQKVYENYDSLSLLEYAISLGDLSSVKAIVQQFNKTTFKNLSFDILQATLKLLEFTSFETLKASTNEESWDQTDADEWENDEIEESEENLQFEGIFNVLNYLLQKGIMETGGNSYLILLATTINLFDGQLRILRKMLPLYKQNLRTEYPFEGKPTSLMHLAIQNTNLPLFKYLIESKYDLYDFSYTSYNPVFEIYKGLTYAKFQKDAKYQVYDQMFDLSFNGNKDAYKRAIGEFYLISKSNFDITDTLSINRLPYSNEIAKFRGYNNQTLLSISPSAEVADAVLGINNLDPTISIPVQNGVLGVAVQSVKIDVMPPILEQMKSADIKLAMPYFLETKELDKFYLAGLYVYRNNENDPFLGPENLLKLGLTNAQIEEFKAYVVHELQKQECCVCGTGTEEQIQCGHYAHYECLAKLTTETCPCCREDYVLPQPYYTQKEKFMKQTKFEKEQNWAERYSNLQEIYGENIPADELYRLTTELGI